MNNIHSQRLLVVDFGSQYTQLIARRVREVGVYCEIHPWDADDEFLRSFKPNGIILSGGPESVTADEAPHINPLLLELGVPVLGICYGMHALAKHFGGEVSVSDKREFGYAAVTRADSELLSAWPETSDVWMSHGDKVTTLPDGFVCTASTPSAPIAAMESAERGLYAVQFHPEVTHTQFGKELYQRFALELCGCDVLWTAANIIEDAITQVREQVGTDHVLLGLSGGVDSSVVAALLSRAIGDQLTCVFVDNGLLRKNESEEVEKAFSPSNALKLNLVVADARTEFMDALADEEEPEAKRKIIGAKFIDVFEREAEKIRERSGEVKWLAQGTIYPDVIESAASKTGKAHVIKSHHNVGGLPERMRMGLVEPLRELFKDEVRAVGLELGLPYTLVNRHPFPGPGLGVRILGGITEEKARVLREADAIFIEELYAADFYYKLSQAFAVHLGIDSVGVVGDARRYASVVALRAVETVDFMTAKWSELPYELLGRVSSRIINEIPEISRVVYDISGKPPATIEWE